MSLAAYEVAGLDYASDARGTHPFYPRANSTVFKTVQIPTTLPTLDELLGRPEYPESKLTDHYLSLLRPDRPNVLTAHAELEGMAKFNWFRAFLAALKSGALKSYRRQPLPPNCNRTRVMFRYVTWWMAKWTGGRGQWRCNCARCYGFCEDANVW